MKALALVLVLFAAFVFLKGETNAQIYKWVDKDGGVHFTDTPTDPQYFSKKSADSNLPPAPTLNIDCKDLDIRTVFQWISDAWGVNILVAGDVRGRATIRRINTRADKLLDEIVLMHNLVRFREENSIVIAKAENARQIQAAIDIQRQLLQTEGERNRLVSKIKSFSDENLKDRKCPPYKKEAIIEAMQLMNSVKMSGDSSDVEFINAMKEFVDAIEADWHPGEPYMLELLADKARAIKGQPGAVRAKPTFVSPSPPPIVNVWR